MATQKQLREEHALEKMVRQAEAIARAFEDQDRDLNPYAVNLANLDTYSTICPDCGQLVPSEYDSFLSQEDADDYARTHCDCHKNTRRMQTMVFTSKNIVALHKRMNKNLLDLIYLGSKAKIADVNGQPWLSDGVAAIIYDDNGIIFSNEKMEEISGIEKLVLPAQKLAFLPNAQLEYLKPCGTCLAAQLKDDNGHHLMINNFYYHLFGDKFDYKLHVPSDLDELRIPMVCVFYLDELAGIILPITQPSN